MKNLTLYVDDSFSDYCTTSMGVATEAADEPVFQSWLKKIFRQTFQGAISAHNTHNSHPI